ncbi:hypothetical protein Naga_101746g2, partial [Nannochloropsis gaditana]
MLEECSGGILLTESRRACEHGMRFLPLSLPSCLLSSFPALITFYRPSSLPFLVPPFIRLRAAVRVGRALSRRGRQGGKERARAGSREAHTELASAFCRSATTASAPRQTTLIVLV